MGKQITKPNALLQQNYFIASTKDLFAHPNKKLIN